MLLRNIIVIDSDGFDDSYEKIRMKRIPTKKV